MLKRFLFAFIAFIGLIVPAAFALALWPAFAQRSDGARLDDLEKVEPCRGADVLALSGVKPFEARLHRRDICAGICKVAIAAR